MQTIPPRIQFFGATGTVTGSKTAIYAGPDLTDRILVDCGLFQGPKELRLRNREPFPVDPASIGAVFITHSHLDHCGYLPCLVLKGFSGPIYCTSPTADLMKILLMDTAHLQEEEANFANKMGYSKHKPALPLYTTDDVLRTLDLVRAVDYNEPVRMGHRISASFHDAGHILGSSNILLRFGQSGEDGSLLMSGDIGRYGAPILPDPESPDSPDWLVMESTYGGRYHKDFDIHQSLADVVNRSIKRGGVLLIPAFAIGRTQLILYTLRQLQDDGSIPDIPVYIDSPMAIRVTNTHFMHEENLDDEARYLIHIGDHPIEPRNLHIFQSIEESKSLNKLQNFAIIISASGMATGGRILHHLKLRLPEPQHTILFIGYQAVGTRGKTIQQGDGDVKIHGEYIPIRAHIESLDGFSAHADQDELITWLRKFHQRPSQIFINHGENESQIALQSKIIESLGINAVIPRYQEEFLLQK